MTNEQKLQLIAAYRVAGLHGKADALAKEMLTDQIGPLSDGGDFKKLQDEMEAMLDNLADKLGVVRKKPKR